MYIDSVLKATLPAFPLDNPPQNRIFHAAIIIAHAGTEQFHFSFMDRTLCHNGLAITPAAIHAACG